MTPSFRLIVLCGLLLSQAAAGAAQKAARNPPPAAPKEYRNLKPQAEETVRALVAGDFAKLADLTHPKVVAMVGGREKMIASLSRQMEEDEAQGVRYDSVSVSVGEPGQVIRVGKRLFAFVPTRLRSEATTRGAVVMESFVLGVSDDGSDNWKFVNVESKAQLRFLFPAAANRLRIPEKKPPAFEAAP